MVMAAGAIGAAGALAIGVIRRQMNFKQFYLACRDGLRTGVMVLFIITGAIIFGHFMAGLHCNTYAIRLWRKLS